MHHCLFLPSWNQENEEEGEDDDQEEDVVVEEDDASEEETLENEWVEEMSKIHSKEQEEKQVNGLSSKTVKAKDKCILLTVAYTSNYKLPPDIVSLPSVHVKKWFIMTFVPVISPSWNPLPRCISPAEYERVRLLTNHAP